MKRRLLAPLLAAALGLAPRAQAQESSAQRADRLFTEANRLANAGDFAAACPRYEESNRLDPAIGTEFNLADCYEHSGRRASSLALFRDVETTAGKVGKAERQRSARQRGDALEPKVPRVRLLLASSVEPPGLAVICDDQPVARADFARGVPLDPGSHTFTARAPDHVAWTQRVDVGVDRGADLTIPELAPVPRPALAAATPAVPPPLPPPTTQKSVALVTGGMGIAALAAGAVSGILSLVEHNSYTKLCPALACSNLDAVSDSHTAVTEGNVSTVTFVAGGVAVAGAIVLWVSASKRTSPTAARVEVVPSIGKGTEELTVMGRF